MTFLKPNYKDKLEGFTPSQALRQLNALEAMQFNLSNQKYLYRRQVTQAQNLIDGWRPLMDELRAKAANAVVGRGGKRENSGRKKGDWAVVRIELRKDLIQTYAEKFPGVDISEDIKEYLNTKVASTITHTTIFTFNPDSIGNL